MNVTVMATRRSRSQDLVTERIAADGELFRRLRDAWYAESWVEGNQET
jgi:hypothetical protein